MHLPDIIAPVWFVWHRFNIAVPVLPLQAGILGFAAASGVNVFWTCAERWCVVFFRQPSLFDLTNPMVESGSFITRLAYREK